MSSTTPRKVGFVGLSTRGWASGTLGPSLVQPSLRDRYTLTAVSTTSETSAKESAAKWSAEIGQEVKAYGDATSLLKGSRDIDLVAVAVKAPSHKDVLLPFIREKKDFFIEWPVGKNSDETREIAAEVKKYGVRSVIGFQGRHSPVLNKVKELIASGKIGKVLSTNFIGLLPREIVTWTPEAKVSNRYILDKSNGATLLTIPNGHMLDAFTYALGDFTSLNTTTVTHFPTTTLVDDEGKPTGETAPAPGPDQITIAGPLASGALATITWRSGIKASTGGRLCLLWEIDGEEGSIKLQSNELTGAFLGMTDPELYVNGEKVVVEGSELGLNGLLTKNWEEFAKGDKGTHATIDDAVRIKRHLDAIDESIATGKHVRI